MAEPTRIVDTRTRKEKLDQIWRENKARQENERIVQVGEAMEWLQRKWGKRACPYCDHAEWAVSSPVEIATTDKTALTPHFPVMCTNCGNTVFINAVIAGIVPDPADQ